MKADSYALLSSRHKAEYFHVLASLILTTTFTDEEMVAQRG